MITKDLATYAMRILRDHAAGGVNGFGWACGPGWRWFTSSR